MKSFVYDVLGVGFGPANLSVAIALEEAGFAGSVGFLEARERFEWQPAMMLRGSDIQHNPLRDLITPVNPCSRFGFVNYLHQSGRFFEYLNLGAVFPLRREFASYVEWAASHFADLVVYGTEVRGLEIVAHPRHGHVFALTSADGHVRRARTVLVAPGRSANIPDVFRPALGPRLFHLNDYLPNIAQLAAPQRIAVIGASQSAVEIMLDLDARFPGAELYGVIRSFGYRMKDISPFTGEVFFPAFTDYYHAASWSSRLRLSDELRATNYAAADADAINQLYLRRYESRLEGRAHHINLINNVDTLTCDAEGERVALLLQDKHNGAQQRLTVDAVVLATGFLDHGTVGQRELAHPLLKGLEAHYAFDPVHGFHVARDYRLIADQAPPLYLNGLCESTHGFGDAGSFSLLSLRARDISQSILAQLQTTPGVRRPAAPPSRGLGEGVLALK